MPNLIKEDKGNISFKSLFLLIGESLSSFLGIIFGSIFLIIGLIFILSGFMTFRDLETLKSTPLTDISSIEEGKVAKFIANTDESVLYKLPDEDQMASFFWIDFNKYYKNDDSIIKKTYEMKRKPDVLTLKSNGKKYLISLVDPEPGMYFTVDITYFYDPSSDKYFMTDRTSFSAGVKTKHERIIFPTEKIYVFGKIKSIEKISNAEYKVKLFRGRVLNPLSNLSLYFSEFAKSLFYNELTLSVVSTKNFNKVEKELKSFNSYKIIIFGVIFSIIPLIVIISLLFNLFKVSIKFTKDINS